MLQYIHKFIAHFDICILISNKLLRNLENSLSELSLSNRRKDNFPPQESIQYKVETKNVNR